jgi:outer membrane biosynthesis protein TonB
VETPATDVTRERDGRVWISVLGRSAKRLALPLAAALMAFPPPALAQDPVPTEPVVTEPSPPAPAPYPAPDPPPAAVTPKPKPKPVQRPAAPAVSRPPSTPQPRVVVPAPSQTAVQRPARPIPRATKPRVEAKKKERPTRTVPAGAVAGATAALPEVSSTVPSDLASGAVDTPSTRDTPGSASLLLTTLIALALALAALASIPTRQLAVLPATRWIVKRRLDLVIAGMGALAALLGVLLISAVFGP